MTPKFSVIIPAYGVEPWIRGCVESVLDSQRRMIRPEEVEVICVDDGSPDRSGAILDEYRDEDSGFQGFKKVSRFQSFRVIHQENAGVSAARNRGLDEAHGDWILFVDGDDQLMPETLPYLERVVDDLDADILHFDCAEVDRQDAPVTFVERPIIKYSLSDVVGARQGYLAMRTLLAWNGCFRRGVIGGVRFKKMHPGEDSLFANEVFVRAARVAKTDTRIYRYLQREGSVMHAPKLPAVMSAIESPVLRYRTMKEWPMYPAIASAEVGTYRNSFGGVVFGRVMALRGSERVLAWKRYLEVGREIFGETPIYGMTYRIGWRWLIDIVLYRQFLARVYYVKHIRKFYRRFLQDEARGH